MRKKEKEKRTFVFLKAKLPSRLSAGSYGKYWAKPAERFLKK